MSGTPSIRISHHQRLYSPSRHSPLSTTDARAATPSTGFTAATPMAIPRAPENPPPPLPPPTFIPEIANGHDVGWQWGNDPNGSDFGRDIQLKPGSSLLGGGSGHAMMMMRNHRPEKEHDHISSSSSSSFANARRGSSISTIVPHRDVDMIDDSLSITNSDEDSGSSRPKSNYRLHGERQLEQRTQEESSNTYDKHLLSRIGGPNGPHTPKRPSISYASGGNPLQETAQLAQAENERRNCILRPLSVPERRPNVLDSPASTSRFPSSGPISPGYGGGFWTEHGPSADPTRAQTRRGSLAFEDQASSHRSSYDQSMYMQEDFMDDSSMSNLNIQDRSPGSDDPARAGTKRRASSPPRDANRDERSSISSSSGHSDIFQRRYVQHMPTRSPPASKYYQTPSSLSSASSYGPRHGSLGSSLGKASVPSSVATSYGSGRLSPNGMSPAMEIDSKVGAPYATTKPLNPAPPTMGTPRHQRNSSESTQPTAQSVPSAPESAQHSRNSSMSHLQSVLICDCCPKKPKKFETEEELRLHESEKQYTCQYCPNRFKNKNEAERHQNSLHLRKQSWSCVALAGVEKAYHQSLSGNGTDVCGFCGDEFANPPQWDIRADHLNIVHKFGECNQTKKFFRADHFRQHLKHSHAGTSGKWTNMLENACMREEPPPEKRVSPTAAQPISPLAVSRSQ